MKTKKGASELVWIVAIIALVLLFLLIYTGIWTKLFGKSVTIVNNNINLGDDNDNDNIINLNDKCPCASGISENQGCPPGYKIQGNDLGSETKNCFSKT